MNAIHYGELRILVTGGAGFIGSHLVDRLVREKPRALGVIDNLFLGKESNLDAARADFPALRFYPESVADAAAFARVVADFSPDLVFNLATIPLPASLTLPEWSYMENIRIAMNPLELAREGRIPALVHFSTSEVYGTARTERIDETHPRDAHTPYAASKAANDSLIDAYRRTFGLKVLILRPFNNYGPRQNEKDYAGVIPKTLKTLFSGGQAELFGDGRQTRDFIFVHDCAEIVVRAAARPELYGEDFNIASGRETAIGDLVSALVARVAPGRAILQRPERPGDVRRHLADTRKLTAHLGVLPETPFDIGLDETIAFYRNTLTQGDSP